MNQRPSRNVAAPLSTLAVTVLVLLAIALPEASAALRAGVAAVNITADKPAEPVRDPLLAKALVPEDGSNRAVIISLDLVVVPETLVTGVRRGVQQELGIDPSCILLNASHNHDTLDAIAGDLVPRIVKAVKQASQNLVPARVGVGVGREERITINRRLRMKDGTQWTIRRATPLPRDTDVAGTGPLDTQIGLLRVDTLAGKPLALVYNFACHAYCGAPGGGISADFPGFASRVIEEAWPGAVALFVQGAAGDVTPVRYKDFDAPAPTEQLGTRLGFSTLHAAQAISTTSQAGVRVLSETIELPRRTDIAERIQTLLAEQEKILAAFTGVGCGSHGAGVALNYKSFLPLYLKYNVDAEHPLEATYSYQQEEAAGRNGLRQLDVDNKKRLETYRLCIENMDKLITVRTNLQFLQQRLEKKETGPLAAEVQVVKIGDFVLVTFPGEAFAEVGLRIKKQSPLPKTFVAGYSNGSLGYAPAAADYGPEAAYEDALTQLAPQWQEIYERKALEMIRRLEQPSVAGK
jgi:hypothetical protein